jgi:hypothetical protein
MQQKVSLVKEKRDFMHRKQKQVKSSFGMQKNLSLSTKNALTNETQQAKST